VSGGWGGGSGGWGGRLQRAADDVELPLHGEALRDGPQAGLELLAGGGGADLEPHEEAARILRREGAGSVGGAADGDGRGGGTGIGSAAGCAPRPCQQVCSPCSHDFASRPEDGIDWVLPLDGLASLVNCWDSVIFPFAATIAPEIAWTIPGPSVQERVKTQWLVSVIRIFALDVFVVNNPAETTFFYVNSTYIYIFVSLTYTEPNISLFKHSNLTWTFEAVQQAI
jgi:hypothetical protein